MGFSKKINYFLVHHLKISNKDAASFIKAGRVRVNGGIVEENIIIRDSDEIELDGTILRKAARHFYIAFYKPVGVESVFNEAADSLSPYFTIFPKLQVCGRLDKASEGLLLLTTDGSWSKKITRPEFRKEKEYMVSVNPEIDELFIENMQRGVDIGLCLTKPCQCEKVSEHGFRIILTEGKNRQIRRMCCKLGRKVDSLKRVRIQDFRLNNLKPGEYEMLNSV